MEKYNNYTHIIQTNHLNLTILTPSKRFMVLIISVCLIKLTSYLFDNAHTS
jgi:hypothetical protein